ncbi:metallophosphoesterase [Cohnella terricola]|nr:metallophosphoesterase [Cohnella terricola]
MILLVWIGVLIFIVICVCIYGLVMEPRSLRITRHEIRSNCIPAAFDGTTIVQFSDTHIGPHYSLKRLRRLADAINSLHPDILVFTGDLHDARRKDNIAKYDPAPILAGMNARLGKYAVYGNHDFGYWKNSRTSGSFLGRGGFTMLVNRTARIVADNGDRILIAGLDDCIIGQPKPKQTLSGVSDETFLLLLAHEPDLANRLINYPIDLQLSGHSHGGQVKLPLFGPFVTTVYGRKYVQGLYTVKGRRRGARPYHLYVNRGIGTTRIPVRIGSVPELSVFTLLRERPTNQS